MKRFAVFAGETTKRLAVLAALAMVASPAAAIFTNGGFEVSTFAGWTQTVGTNLGLTGVPPFTSGSLNIGAPGGHTFDGAFVGAAVDPQAPTLVLPRAGTVTARIGSTIVGGFIDSISQQDAITNADRDAGDNLLHVRFSYAAVLQDSGHPDNQRPFFFVRLRNITKATTLFEDFTYETAARQDLSERTPAVALYELCQRRHRRPQRRSRRHARDSGIGLGLLANRARGLRVPRRIRFFGGAPGPGGRTHHPDSDALRVGADRPVARAWRRGALLLSPALYAEARLSSPLVLPRPSAEGLFSSRIAQWK